MGTPCTEVNLELDWCSEDYGYNPGSYTERGKLCIPSFAGSLKLTPPPSLKLR